MAWATREQARTHWTDAPGDDEVLDVLLSVAEDQCRAYAPTVVEPVPARYMYATVLQAREVYNAGQSNDGGFIGFGDYAREARPLTSHVKSLLRPQEAVPHFGGRGRR